MSRRYLAVVVALVSASLASDSWARSRPVDESHAFEDGGSLRVNNTAGDVEVLAWDRDEISVTGEVWDGIEELVVEVQGSRARVQVVNPRRARNIEPSDLIIRVPRNTSLDIQGVSMDVSVDGVAGDQRINTVSGDVDTGLWGAEVDARTISGEISVDGFGRAGMLDLNTTSGAVFLLNGAGQVRASAVSGEVRIEGEGFEWLDLETISGDLQFEGSLARNGDLDAEAVSGNVYLYFSGEVDARFELSTFNGDIDNEFGPRPRRTSRYAPGMELEFETGDGSGVVRAETLNGNIRLRQR